MSSLTKAESARINGAISRGPKTPPGRAAVSMNAFSYGGLTAKTLILQRENPDQFTKMLNFYFDSLQPTNRIEVDLIADMVAARWRLRRIRFETAMLDIEMDSHALDFKKRFDKYDADTRGGVAFSAMADKSKGLSTTLPYDIHLSRTYRRSLQELYRLRGARLQNKPTEPAKSQLNGKIQALNGAQKQGNPTHEHISYLKSYRNPRHEHVTNAQCRTPISEHGTFVTDTPYKSFNVSVTGALFSTSGSN